MNEKKENIKELVIDYVAKLFDYLDKLKEQISKLLNNSNVIGKEEQKKNLENIEKTIENVAGEPKQKEIYSDLPSSSKPPSAAESDQQEKENKPGDNIGGK